MLTGADTGADHDDYVLAGLHELSNATNIEFFKFFEYFNIANFFMHTSIFSQFLTMKLKMNKCIKNFKIFLIFLTICVCGSSLIKYCLITPVNDSNLKQNLEKFYNKSERSSYDSILIIYSICQ